MLSCTCSVQCDQKGSAQLCSVAKCIVEGKCLHIRAGLRILQTTFAPVLNLFFTQLGVQIMLRAVKRAVQLEHSPWADCIFGRKIKYVETAVLLSLQFIVWAG